MNIDLSDAKYRLRAMGDKAHKGEEVVIMKDGQPWLRLTPCPDYTSPHKSRAEPRDTLTEDEDCSLPEWAWLGRWCWPMSMSCALSV